MRLAANKVSTAIDALTGMDLERLVAELNDARDHAHMRTILRDAILGAKSAR